MFYLGLGIGLFVGATTGIVIAALCVVAKSSDK